MAFKKKPGVDVAVMVKPHGKGPDLSGPGSLEPPEPGDTGDEPEKEPDADEGAITPEEVDYSDNDLCGSCAHNQEGTCAKYGFPVDDSGHCEGGYEPQGGEGAAGGGAPPMPGAGGGMPPGGSPYGR